MERTVVITGASGGLGRELYKLFAVSKDACFSLSRSNPDGAENFIKCDVSDENSVKSAMDEVNFKRGGIDILICNAGVGIAGALEETPSKSFDSVTDINYRGVFYTLKYALPYIKEGGRIITISSASAMFALPYRSVYCASKSAVNMLTFGLYMELKGQNIKVSAICPGEIDTPFVENRIKLISDGGRYSKNLKNITEEFKEKRHSRMPVSFAAEKIHRIIEKKKLKPFYIIGRKYKFLYFASKILPMKVLLDFTGKKYGG